MDRTAIVAALRVLPDDITLTIPVPSLLRLLGPESGGDDLLSTKEVAGLLKRTPGAVTAWIRKGSLPARMVGRSYRITRDDLSAFLDQNPTSHAPESEVGSPTPAEAQMCPGTWRGKRQGGGG